MEIINPKNIQNPKIKFDFNNLHGIGMILNFKYQDGDKEKEFKRRLNKVIEIDDEKVEIKTKNTLGSVKNLYQYTPDLLFLTSSNPSFYNALKKEFENGYDKLYGLVSYENEKIFILPDLEIDTTINFKIENEKEKNKELKVYETPKKVFDFIANILDETIKDILIDEVAKKLVKAKEAKLFEADLEFLTLQEALKNKNLEKIKALAEEKFEKNKELIEFVMNLPDKNIFKYLKDHERELTLFKLDNVLKIKPVFMDFQAGSGIILDSLKEKGFDNAILTGTELRDIKRNDENYKVVTGVNFSLINETIKNVLSNENRKKMIESIFNYSNPLYSTDDLTGKKSIDTIKEGSLVFGLYPVKMLSYLKERIKGVIYNISKEAIGYKDSNSPQRYLLVIGQKLSDDAIETIKMRMQKSKTGVIELDVENLNKIKIPYFVKEKIKNNLVYSMKTDYSNFLEDFKKAINSTIERYKNISKIQTLLKEKKDEILNAFLPFENLKKAKIFPDTRFFSKDSRDIKYYTFEEVAQNVPLLSFYKRVNPELYMIVEKIAKDLDYPLPELNENEFRYSFTNTKPLKKDLVTNDNLGMMKFKYLPDIIEIKDEKNKEILKDLVNKYIEKNNLELDERSLNALELVINRSDYLILKNEHISRGNTIFNNEVFVFVDKFGKDIAKFEILPSDFYKLLEEEGYFNINDYIELATLKENEYIDLIDKFLKYMENVKKEIINFNVKNFKEFYNEKNQDEILKEFNKDLINYYKQYAINMKKAKETQNPEYQKKAFSLIREFGDKYHFKEIYNSKFELIDSKKLIQKAVNKYKNLSKEEKEEIVNLIYSHFNKREVTFFEIERSAFFNQLNEKYNLEEKIDFENFILDVEDALSEPYQMKKLLYAGYIRLADVFVTGITPLELAYKQDKKLAINLFEKLFVNKLRLKPHQFNEAIKYFALNDDRKVEMLFWEMRAGKTRTMLAIGFLNALKTGKDFDLIVETGNMNDIAYQTLESFPFLLLNSKFFVGDNKKININNENVYEMLLTENIIPNLPKVLQPYLVGKGKKAEELAQTFYTDILEIRDKLNNENIKNVENYFKNTPFVKCLGVCEE